MTRSPTLILSHLIKTKILEDNGADEVLTLLEHDAASSIAVTTVSSFSTDGSFPRLDSEFKINWMMQAIAYCFSLSTLYQDAISTALDIFHRWLTSSNFFKDKETHNKYAQQIFRYMSLVVDFQNDNLYPGARQKLIEKLQRVLRDCITKSSYFDEQTWDTLIRVLIGCSDFLTTEYIVQTLSDTIRIPLLEKFLELTFLTISFSKLTTETVWELIRKYISKWAFIEQFMHKWSLAIQNEYEIILTTLFNDKLQKNENIDRNIISGAAFRISQYTNSVNPDEISKEIPLFTIFSLMFEKLMKISQNFVEKCKDLYIPRFPADLYFSLFGKNIFEPFAKYDPVLLKIHSSILMFICGSWDLSNSKWEPYVLTMVLKSIKEQMKFITVMTGYQLLSGYMNDQIVDSFLNMLVAPNPVFYTDEIYYYNYAIIIQQLSEVRLIDQSIFRNIISGTEEARTMSLVFSIVSKQDPSLFVEELAKVINKYSSSSFVENIILNVNLIVAASIPFNDISLKPYMDIVLPVISERGYSNSALLMSFLVLVAQISLIGNQVLKSDFTEQFVQFADQNQNSGVSRYINYTVGMLCALPLDTSLLNNTSFIRAVPPKVDDRLLLKPVFSVLVGDDHLIFLAGDKTRKSSFIVHIREPRGSFAFELTDEPAPNNLSEIPKPSDLHLPPSTAVNPVESDPCRIEGAEDRMMKVHATDKSYSEPNTKKYQHISIRSEQKDDEEGKLVMLRHKFIDFLFQTGLQNNIYKVDDELSVIKQFDVIESVPIIPIKLIHLSHEKIDDETPSYSRFKQSLGSLFINNNLISENGGSLQSRVADMGVCRLNFDARNTESEIAVIFSESSMNLNTKSPDFPHHKLTIIVEQHSADGYRISVLSTRKAFVWTEPEFRFIKSANIGKEIASIAFIYFMTVKPESVFKSIEMRNEFFQKLNKTALNPFEIANSLPPDNFKPILV
ncbi:hypothetical protein TVAG_486170 [Trichomonas vaginalis G3]|uniref:Ral GTPase-activating protein subunit alpha/beta N-terminal domain-containing protein n=1 Tax=Trichomonas vaginalis (strain ATCC PRA-98 / G3) TaxID=412133 RepID=A2EEG4_TRIV3|nr:hypothetical protein TVAGG3_0691240 [Trichomonas vaginalis G3]EAY08970.1 hypothetical protein TVAG_486170 [Trichomonas vaginalis G3]KAI5508582.1 hypothetical protein TVAGG3_0691240 [Trichomonas vaginalis G3]|eukprot:XP_001321193.1 hypothetical protein [Trichomonas vaginalis G3]